MKRVSTRAVIFEDDNIVLILRRKKINGDIKEYYSLPGGGQEDGETLKYTTIREVKEELNYDVNILGYLGVVEDDKSIQYFYHCKKIGGNLEMIGEEKEISCNDNYYEPVLIPISDIHNINIWYTDIIDKAIRKEYLD